MLTEIISNRGLKKSDRKQVLCLYIEVNIDRIIMRPIHGDQFADIRIPYPTK